MSIRFLFYLLQAGESVIVTSISRKLIVIFYVSLSGNIEFRSGKRMFPLSKTYVFRQQNVKKGGRFSLFYKHTFRFYEEVWMKASRYCIRTRFLAIKKIVSMMLENQLFVILCRKNMKKNARNVCGFQKMHYLCNRNRERKQRKKNLMVR